MLERVPHPQSEIARHGGVDINAVIDECIERRLDFVATLNLNAAVKACRPAVQGAAVGMVVLACPDRVVRYEC
jgi:hypothetical protein